MDADQMAGGQVVPGEEWKAQLYMWEGNRNSYLKRHRFYGKQIRKRVLGQFMDMEAEAESYARETYERGTRLWGEDDSGIAEVAHSAGVDFYGLLEDLRVQTLLGALAGMYHQWDKELRNFMEWELRHDVTRERARVLAWAPNIGEVFDLIEKFGWSLRNERWFNKLDACRLVINVHKHGRGNSLDQLAAKYPEYLRSPLGDVGLRDEAQYEHLGVTEDQFSEFDAAITCFWEAFPERLFYPAGNLLERKEPRGDRKRQAGG